VGALLFEPHLQPFQFIQAGLPCENKFILAGLPCENKLTNRDANDMTGGGGERRGERD
jgi:hypothetical protein